jgi:hypothetical protein
VDSLVKIVRWEILSFLVALAATVVFQLLTGRINMNGLLRVKLGESRGNLSPPRVQLLLATLGAAMYYVLATLETAKMGKLPELPDAWPAVLGGSNLIYLGGKAYARFFTEDRTKKG